MMSSTPQLPAPPPTPPAPPPAPPTPTAQPPSPASTPAPAPKPVDSAPEHPRPRRTRIKICGITTPELAIVAAEAGADAIGIVFAPGSPRQVLPGLAIQITRALPPLVSAVGVFRNPSDPDVANWRGEWVQLHGNEVDSQAARLAAQHRRVIKGIAFDAVQIVKWDHSSNVQALLIDSAAPGSGTSFDHASLASLMPALRTPVILAGGLTPDNVGDAIRAVRPFAVDVSSGVESSKGVKDAGMIRAFCAAVRGADASADAVARQ